MPRAFFFFCFIVLFEQVKAQPKTKPVQHKQHADSLNITTTDTFSCILQEKWAQFPGGYVAMKRYLEKNSQSLVEAANKNETYGKIYMKFIITDTGIIDSVKVLKGINGCLACDEETIKLIKNMPKWEPAQLQNVNVKSWYTLPVPVVKY